MGNDLIKMGDLYFENVLSETFNSPANDDKNSYTYMNQPGGAQHTQAGMSQVSQNSSPISFPGKDISNQEKIKLLKKFLKDEIDNGDWDDKLKTAFKDFLNALL